MNECLQHEASIVFIEDNSSDQIIVKKIIQKHLAEIPICYSTGLQFFEALSEIKSSHKLPKLILVDLNMPKMNGSEIIKGLKQDELFRNIPVVVLSSSNTKEDIENCYQMEINAYVFKSLDFDEYSKNLVKALDFCLNPSKC